MIKKLILTDVFRMDKDKKTGEQFKTKDGKPYQRVLIKTAEYGNDILISGFGGAWNSDWKAGEEITVDITEVKKDEKTFYNFSKVNMEQRMMEMIKELNTRVRALERKIIEQQEYPIRTEDNTPNFDKLNEELEMEAQSQEDLYNNI